MHAGSMLRVASYNVRVDHTEDYDTVHDWPLRRRPVASTILGLGADLVALQEPSPVQVDDLEADLGPEWGVAAAPCDPDAWAATEPEGGPPCSGNPAARSKTDIARFALMNERVSRSVVRSSSQRCAETRCSASSASARARMSSTTSPSSATARAMMSSSG